MYSASGIGFWGLRSLHEYWTEEMEVPFRRGRKYLFDLSTNELQGLDQSFRQGKFCMGPCVEWSYIAITVSLSICNQSKLTAWTRTKFKVVAYRHKEYPQRLKKYCRNYEVIPLWDLSDNKTSVTYVLIFELLYKKGYK